MNPDEILSRFAQIVRIYTEVVLKTEDNELVEMIRNNVESIKQLVQSKGWNDPNNIDINPISSN